MSTKKSMNPPKKLGRVSTIARAASLLGWTEEVVKAAKNAGLAGFDDHDRIDCDVLRDEINKTENQHVLSIADAAITKEQAEIRRILLQCQKLDYQNAVMRGEYVLASEIDTWQTEKAEALKRLLATKFTNEMLPKLQGLGIPEQIPIVRSYITAVVADFKKPMAKQ